HQQYGLLFLLIIFCTSISNAQTITISPLQNNNICACSPINIDYTATGVFNAANIFTAQLSDALGNFAAPTNIGILNGNANAGTINCTIPCNTPYGTNYRVRIVSSSPVIISPDNGINITINPSPQVNITQTGGNCSDTLTANVNLNAAGPIQGNKYYITNVEPWGVYTNENEMNIVFGVGGWIQGNFMSPTAATVFAPSTQFVFLEGSDFNADALNQYMMLNGPLIENWVNSGGRLFINAAPNVGSGQNWGFGGVFLNYQNLIPINPNDVPGVNITNMAHPINVGPYLPVDPNGVYTGNYFAHANIINGGATLIHSSTNPNDAVLTEKPWGSGLVLFGGMTTTNWHNNVPGLQNQHAINLRLNILNYLAGAAINPSYTYLWTPGGQVTPKIVPPNTGIYTVTVTTNAGCTSIATYNYIQQNAPVNVHIVASGNMCKVGDNVILDAGGGFVSYTWDNGANTQTRTINAPGTYWVTVTNAQGCVGTDTIIINLNPPINLNITYPPIQCNGGSTTLTVNGNGGNPPYVFSINGGGFQPNNYFQNVTAGTYTILVSDASGCTATTIITVSEPPILDFNFTLTQANCSGDATVVINANGGTAPYQYSISPIYPFQPNNQFNNIAAGTYTITVSDASGCSKTTLLNVLPIPVMNITVSDINNVKCNGQCDGSAQLIISGAATPYNIAIAPQVGNINQVTGAISALCEGTYTITVTDANNCIKTTTFVITAPPTMSLSANVINVSCYGLCNGSAQMNAVGGGQNYNYSISPNGNINPNTGLASNLCPGNYTVTVTDNNGCFATTTFNVIEPQPILFDSIIIQDNICSGNNSATIDIYPNGGVLPYSYTLNPGMVVNNTGQFTGLNSGNYTIAVSDFNGCQIDTTVVIKTLSNLSFSQVNIHEVYCNGDSTGSIAVVTNGGNGNVIYTINPAKPQVPEGFFKYLNAGTYTIIATDAIGCSITTTVNVTENPKLQINDLNYVEPICAYDSTGIIQINATGGVPPLLYSLNNGTPNQTGLFTGLIIDQYKITLIDNLGCRKDTNINLTGPSLVGANIQIESTKCIDSKDGKVHIQGTGGLGGYKYFITPDLNLNKTGIFFDLASGIYTVRVVDTVGCEYKTEITVNGPSNPLNISITKEDLKCYGRGNEGNATVHVSGGEMPYVYKWSTDPVQNTATASGLYFGWYNVLITDANGCEKSDTVYISEGPCCQAAFIPSAFSPNGDQVNDEFKILSTAGMELIKLEIYDRWGQKLWTNSD
ncbi:MAG: gliding motility-associated C-terminal domain-containing protein, partial [Bacteroidia bacterium]|nr:gliding motility-associated C-terminal domain-containing protein [Bacteroidia bacterium]